MISVPSPVSRNFQVVLYDPDYYPTETGDGDIIMYYKNVEMPENCTIGIENHTQDVGIEYVFNNNYNPTASGIMNNFAIRFTTEPPFASIITSTDEMPGDPNTNGLALDQNRPNPFSSATWISYELPEAGQVSLTVFDVNGGLVCTLFSGKQQAGSHTIMWNGMNSAGIDVSSGVYFYQLKTDRITESKKMFLLR
jgi:hypothetical protein